MFFSIETQQNIVLNWYKQLEQRGNKLQSFDRIPGLDYSIDVLNTAHLHFMAHTKTTFGYMRSFVPFTFAYKCRVAYHHRIIEVCDKLRQLEASIEKAEKLEIRNVSRRTKSEPELPGIYPSPIASKPVTKKSGIFNNLPKLIFKI